MTNNGTNDETSNRWKDETGNRMKDEKGAGRIEYLKSGLSYPDRTIFSGIAGRNQQFPDIHIEGKGHLPKKL